MGAVDALTKRWSLLDNSARSLLAVRQGEGASIPHGVVETTPEPVSSATVSPDLMDGRWNIETMSRGEKKVTPVEN